MIDELTISRGLHCVVSLLQELLRTNSQGAMKSQSLVCSIGQLLERFIQSILIFINLKLLVVVVLVLDVHMYRFVKCL